MQLQHASVYAVRHVRPRQLVLDLHGVRKLDSFNVGTLAAACHLGDDHVVAVLFDNSGAVIADQLVAAGVGGHRLR